MSHRWENLWVGPEAQILVDESMDSQEGLRRMEVRTTGIMCQHCAERLKVALEGTEGVVSARTSPAEDRTEIVYQESRLEWGGAPAADAVIIKWASYLLGIMAEAGSLASQVLFEVGLDLVTVENYIYQHFQGYPSANEDQRILRTNDVELVLILAQEEASWLGQEVVNTEHMLLGLTRWQEREGGAVTMLKSLGVAPGRVRRTMRQMLQAARLAFGLAIEAANRDVLFEN